MVSEVAVHQAADTLGSHTAQAQAVAQARFVSDTCLEERALGHKAGLLGLPSAEEQPCLSEAV